MMNNRHIQTLYASFFRKDMHLDFEREIFELSDGDFLESYWLNKPKKDEATPIVTLFHGLDGSYKSPYIQGMMKKLASEGYAVVVMHFRGCADKTNRLPKAYHSGYTTDALEWLSSLKKEYKRAELFAVGFSLGANMLLKLLSENQTILNKAVAVSTPFLLDVCAEQMDKGFAKLYQFYLLYGMKKAVLEQYKLHDMQALLGISGKLNT